jgi:hypothetical protein
MKKITFSLIIIASLLLTASRPSRPAFESHGYRIYVEKSDKNIAYKVNDFYSVYYVYMNVIRALDINDRLGEGDIEKVIFIIIDNLKKNNVVQLQVDNHKGSGILRVTLRPEITPKGGKPILLIVSNYNANTKQVVSGDDQKDAYGTFFYFIGNKLVKNKYIHEPKNETELKKLSKNSLADYYLLDEDAGNDALGKNLLTKEIEKSGEEPERALLYMTLSEYHLLSGKADSAKQCLDNARVIIGSLKDEKSKLSLSNILLYANDLFKYYKAIAGRVSTGC